MTEPVPEGAKVLTDAEVAAFGVGWQVAHNELCRLRDHCSAHQPMTAQAQRARVVGELLADPTFMALKEREGWPLIKTSLEVAEVGRDLCTGEANCASHLHHPICPEGA